MASTARRRRWRRLALVAVALPATGLAVRHAVRTEPATSRELVATLEGHDSARAVWSVAFSPDGELIASGAADGTVRLWDPVEREQVAVLRSHPEAGVTSVFAVAFSPDGELLATGDDSGVVRLWDPSAAEQVGVLAPEATGDTNGAPRLISSLAFSPDGDLLATGDDSGVVRLWDTTTRQQVAVLPADQGFSVLSVAFSPDGDLLAVTDDDAVVVWDPATGDQVTTLPGGEHYADAVAFSPTGDRIATGDSAGAVRIWDTRTGARADAGRLPEENYDPIFSPDGDLVVAVRAGAIRLWNPVTGERVAVLTGHDGWVNDLAIGPAGNLLASAGTDGTVRLWQLPVPAARDHPPRPV